MAVCRLPSQEAQTAAGVRGSRFLPKTARRAPQALEAGAFWDHQPKACRNAGAVRLAGWFWWTPPGKQLGRLLELLFR